MPEKSRVTTVKTLKYSVFEQRCQNRTIHPTTGTAVRKPEAKIDGHGARASSPNPSSVGVEDAQVFPPTERLYMQDTYQMTAEATVLGLVRNDNQGTAMILDRTIFHPQGGGQPSDQGTITCCGGGSCTMSVSIVRDVGGIIHHFGDLSGASAPLPGERVSLSLDGAKRRRHAVLHSAGHAVDTAMVAAAGPGVFSPSKGYHFEDSPYVEYLGKLPDSMDKDLLLGMLNNELEKLVAADMETKIQNQTQGYDQRGRVPAGNGNSDANGNVNGKSNPEGSSPPTGEGTGSGSEAAASGGGGVTRIVTVAGLACPCGGTHVRSTRQLEGVRVTKLKAKKGTLRVSYAVPSLPTPAEPKPVRQESSMGRK